MIKEILRKDKGRIKIYIGIFLTILSWLIYSYSQYSIYAFTLGVTILYVNALIFPFFEDKINTPLGIPFMLLLFINLSLFEKTINKGVEFSIINSYWALFLKGILLLLLALIFYKKYRNRSSGRLR